jgi:hypothetical protein
VDVPATQDQEPAAVEMPATQDQDAAALEATQSQQPAAAATPAGSAHRRAAARPRGVSVPSRRRPWVSRGRFTGAGLDVLGGQAAE